MADRKPLVVVDGQVQELPAGDGLTGVYVEPMYAEPVIAIGFNTNVVYEGEDPLVPNFVTTSDGDIVTAGV